MAINHFPLVSGSGPHWPPHMTPSVNVKYCVCSLVWRLARSLRHPTPQNEDWLWRMWARLECAHSYFSWRFYNFLVGSGSDILSVGNSRTCIGLGNFLFCLLSKKCHPQLGSNFLLVLWRTWELYAQPKLGDCYFNVYFMYIMVYYDLSVTSFFIYHLLYSLQPFVSSICKQLKILLPGNFYALLRPWEHNISGDYLPLN